VLATINVFCIKTDTRWGVSGQPHASARLHPRKEAVGTHWMGGSVAHRAGLDV